MESIKQKKKLIAVGGVILLLIIAVGTYYGYTVTSKDDTPSIDNVLSDLDELIDSTDGESELDPLTADELGFDYQSEGIDQVAEDNEEGIDGLDENIDIPDLDAEELGF